MSRRHATHLHKTIQPWLHPVEDQAKAGTDQSGDPTRHASNGYPIKTNQTMNPATVASIEVEATGSVVIHLPPHWAGSCLEAIYEMSSPASYRQISGRLRRSGE